ncbi:MAG: hypothetical protein K8S00_05145, partial [Bacteroidales bacterium]|nr:hypothetical protein [Bacteroidales bacterium]
KVHNYYVYAREQFANPTITMSSMSPISKNFYFSTYSLVRYGWAEFVVGFDVPVTNWMIVGLKAGVQTETNGTMGRYQAVMYIKKNKLNGFGGFEWGGDRTRSQAILGYRIKAFNPGIMEAHNGDLVAIGPMLEYYIPKTIITIYGSAMAALEDGRFASQFGIYLRFLPKPVDKFEEMEMKE